MNRYNLIFLLMFFCSAYSAAQDKDGTSYISNADEYFKEFTDANFGQPVKIPFKNIVVHDFRYDTSKIGYVQRASPRSAYSKIKTKVDWTQLLNKYFNNNLDATSKYTLVLVLRSFWLQEGIIDELVEKNVVTRDAFDPADYGGICHAGVDAFIKYDSLTPFFKVDDNFIEFYKFKSGRIEKFFFLAFDSIATKIASSDVAAVAKKRRKLSYEDMLSFYKKRLEEPALTPLGTKGIFLTFEDFKNNKPLVVDYRLAEGKLTDELYIVKNKQEDLLVDFWGFTDGTHLYIKLGYSVYKSIKQGNTYEVYGGKHISNYHNNPAPGSIIRINSMGIEKKILQLNMETGKFY